MNKTLLCGILKREEKFLPNNPTLNFRIMKCIIISGVVISQFLFRDSNILPPLQYKVNFDISEHSQYHNQQ